MRREKSFESQNACMNMYEGWGRDGKIMKKIFLLSLQFFTRDFMWSRHKMSCSDWMNCLRFFFLELVLKFQSFFSPHDFFIRIDQSTGFYVKIQLEILRIGLRKDVVKDICSNEWCLSRIFVMWYTKDIRKAKAARIGRKKDLWRYFQVLMLHLCTFSFWDIERKGEDNSSEAWWRKLLSKKYSKS